MGKCEISCFDCKNGEFIRGSSGSYYDPPEPDTVECKHSELPVGFYDKLDEQIPMMDAFEDHAPKYCGLFEPIMAVECQNRECKKPLNVPRYEHKLWAYAEEGMEVCSIECKEKIEKEFADYFEEMYRICK